MYNTQQLAEEFMDCHDYMDMNRDDRINEILFAFPNLSYNEALAIEEIIKTTLKNHE